MSAFVSSFSSKFQSMEAVLEDVVSSLADDFLARAKNGAPITQADADAVMAKAIAKISSIVEQIEHEIQTLRDQHDRMVESLAQTHPPAFLLDELTRSRASTRH